MNNDQLATLKKQYVAAMSAEMKSPLEQIIGLISDSDKPAVQKDGEIRDAAKYLLSLVNELAQFAKGSQ